MPRIGFAAAWRETARNLLCQGVHPDEVEWSEEGEERRLLDPLAAEQRERGV